MPRRSSGAVRRQRTPAAAPTPTGGWQQYRELPEGTFVERAVSGSAATKPYRCPGCDHEVAVGVAHVVVWPADGDGADRRRHWHSTCWQRRATRGGPGPLPW